MGSRILKRFIVIEGLDGAGTTTQKTALTAFFQNQDLPVWSTYEPHDSPVGQLIRQALRKEVLLEAGTMAYLFAGNRYEHIFGPDGIASKLDQGYWVICDRYLFSSLAYQGILYDWDRVLELNSPFPLPEHLFFLDLPVQIAQDRLKNRDSHPELYDATETQIRIHGAYHRVLEHYKDSGMKISLLDGSKSPLEITATMEKILFP